MKSRSIMMAIFLQRSPSTPTPSRPHTPQTPSYGPGPALPAMVLPTTYVVTTGQPAFNPTPNQGNRYRKGTKYYYLDSWNYF